MSVLQLPSPRARESLQLLDLRKGKLSQETAQSGNLFSVLLALYPETLLAMSVEAEVC